MMMRASHLFCVVVAACAEHHVVLAPPPPTLTPDQRVMAFMSLRPVDQRDRQVSTDGGSSWEVTSSSLTLATRQEVVLPEDLLPVVANDSATARAAKASIAARKRNHVAYVTMIITGLVGFVLTGELGSDDRPWNLNPWAAWSLGLAPPLIAYITARHYMHVELDERKAAFAHYTRDLGDRLNVCAKGLEVVPCDEPTPVAPPTTTIPARTASLFDMR